MATKKFNELQEYDNDRLARELDEIQGQYQDLKFDHAVKGMDNPMLLKAIRRDIARLKTEMRKRELAEMSEGQLAKRSKIRARRRRK